MAFFPFLLAAQKDTVEHNNVEGFVHGTVFSSRTWFIPVEDTIYYRSDSSLFNGILHVEYVNRSCKSKRPEVLIQESWYIVKEGVSTLNHAVNYFADCEKAKQSKIISAESFFSDTLIRFISYKANGKPWSFESYFIDPGRDVISEKKVLNNEGTLIYNIQYLNDYMHGITQIIVSNGDTLSLLYHIRKLSDVLTKNVRFLSANGKRISKSEFLAAEKDWSHSWSFAVIKHRKKPKLVLYRINPDKCEYLLLQENNCIPGTGKKRSFRRKLLKKQISPYNDYSFSSFEGTFKRREKVIRNYIDSLKGNTNTISIRFGTDSSYHIEVEAPRLEQGTIRRLGLNYTGKYVFDEKGDLVLLGDHPFESNILRMKEIPEKGYVYTLGFTVRMKEELKWITKGKVYLNCDGECTYDY
ncbi:hypothetical protein Fluta_2642 [Fluviicola taffensis DSM 16823]|uniref:Uncharacterized protein n=2 Tax=Fluviicola TaxID=332102 RepID=F2IFD9_FLUTR|nr:hypothetical protein Fluta_2642 [Fluviicola taffensis DSM 16823]